MKDMIGINKRPSIELARMRLLSLCALVLVLQACVTTTTGGFTVEVSEEEALEDYIQLAKGYFDAGDMVSARRHVNNALEIDARNSETHNVLALIYQREGDLDLADDYFRRAISLDRDNSRARNNYAAFLFSEQRYSEAFEQLERVTADASYEGRAIAFENLGRAALRLERYEQAENAFTRALQLNSNLYFSSLELAALRVRAENWQAARQSFAQYRTTAQFYNIPYTPRALLLGIQIEGRFNNRELVEEFALILATLHQNSPEFQAYQRLSNAN